MVNCLVIWIVAVLSKTIIFLVVANLVKSKLILPSGQASYSPEYLFV